MQGCQDMQKVSQLLVCCWVSEREEEGVLEVLEVLEVVLCGRRSSSWSFL